jgi:hypothetical protein
MNTQPEKPMSKTYRFKFSERFLENLKEFTRIHKFDQPKAFKENFETWKEDNKETVSREINYMINMGYEGDVIGKMYKSARYYFKNKSNEKIKPKKRRQYIGIDITLKDKMDEYIQEKVDKKVDCKPSNVYNEFIEDIEHKVLLDTETTRLKSFGMKDDEVIKKFKKTFKNRYFIKFK